MSFPKTIALIRFCKFLKPHQLLKVNNKFDNNNRTTLMNLRFVSTAEPKHQPTSRKEDVVQFDKVFTEIVADLLNEEKFKSLSEISSRFGEVLRYNAPHGKKNRGLAVVDSYKIFEKTENLTDENIRLANILGWSVEMLQAFFVIMDDIVDGSETRRGLPCWYKNPNIGLTAINDGLLLENTIYLLLKKYFSNHQSYVHFLELYFDVTKKTIWGQLMDCHTVDIADITLKRFDLIAYYKTAYYTFYLPVALAMYMSNYTDRNIHQHSKKILLEIGKFFQMQDDYLDCFGDPKITGKIGTDIETGKCTWLAGTAIQIAPPSLKEIIKENYGKRDLESVKKVKEVYLELGIPKLFKSYEEESYNKFQVDIQNLPKEKPRVVLNKLLAMVYKRNF